MKHFDFDKFSRSSWIGASVNRAWKRYGIETHTDSAKGELGEHNFLTPFPTDSETPYTERCICGWSGPCWADHLAAAVDGTPESGHDQAFSDAGEESSSKQDRKKSSAKAQVSSDADDAGVIPDKGDE